MTGHTAHTGHTRALDTERESQVTHGDLDHGARVHLYILNISVILVECLSFFVSFTIYIFDILDIWYIKLMLICVNLV